MLNNLVKWLVFSWAILWLCCVSWLLMIYKTFQVLTVMKALSSAIKAWPDHIHSLRLLRWLGCRGPLRVASFWPGKWQWGRRWVRGRPLGADLLGHLFGIEHTHTQKDNHFSRFLTGSHVAMFYLENAWVSARWCIFTISIYFVNSLCYFSKRLDILRSKYAQ